MAGSSIQGFFWDYDNTILETAEAHWNKHCVVLARHGIMLNESGSKRIYENNGNQNWEWFKEELGLRIPQKEYLQEVDAQFKEYLAHLEMRPGIAELFQFIDDAGIPQAIITNARRDSAEPVLKEKNILPLMKFVLFKEDYEGRKPDPAPYLAGLNKMAEITGLSIDPKRCIAIEDDPKGVESAHRAGVIAIHRKLNEGEESSPFAQYSCFHKDDFIRLVKSLVNC